MAPLPDNNTAVLYMDYTTGRRQHTAQIRLPSSQSPAAGVGVLVSVLTSLQTVLPNTWAVQGWRFRAQGQTITLPYAAGASGVFVGTGDPNLPEMEEAREWVFVGRSTAQGRRWELSLYGIKYNTPADYRYNTADMPPGLQDALDNLTDAAAGQFIVAIDGDEPVIYPYVNVNYNSYWESRARRG
jgi:hypothetical protein